MSDVHLLQQLLVEIHNQQIADEKRIKVLTAERSALDAEIATVSAEAKACSEKIEKLESDLVEIKMKNMRKKYEALDFNAAVLAPLQRAYDGALHDALCAPIVGTAEALAPPLLLQDKEGRGDGGSDDNENARHPSKGGNGDARNNTLQRSTNSAAPQSIGIIVSDALRKRGIEWKGGECADVHVNDVDNDDVDEEHVWLGGENTKKAGPPTINGRRNGAYDFSPSDFLSKLSGAIETLNRAVAEAWREESKEWQKEEKAAEDAARAKGNLVSEELAQAGAAIQPTSNDGHTRCHAARPSIATFFSTDLLANNGTAVQHHSFTAAGGGGVPPNTTLSLTEIGSDALYFQDIKKDQNGDNNDNDNREHYFKTTQPPPPPQFSSSFCTGSKRGRVVEKKREAVSASLHPSFFLSSGASSDASAGGLFGSNMMPPPQTRTDSFFSVNQLNNHSIHGDDAFRNSTTSIPAPPPSSAPLHSKIVSAFVPRGKTKKTTLNFK